jgi:hypothetical protein
LCSHVEKRFYTLRERWTKIREKKNGPVEKPVRERFCRFGAGLLLCSGCCGNVGVLFVETLHTACGIDQFLLASEKRMAIGADFNSQHVALNG